MENATCFKWLQNGDILRSPVTRARQNKNPWTCKASRMLPNVPSRAMPGAHGLLDEPQKLSPKHTTFTFNQPPPAVPCVPWLKLGTGWLGAKKRPVPCSELDGHFDGSELEVLIGSRTRTSIRDSHALPKEGSTRKARNKKWRSGMDQGSDRFPVKKRTPFESKGQ